MVREHDAAAVGRRVERHQEVAVAPEVLRARHRPARVPRLGHDHPLAAGRRRHVDDEALGIVEVASQAEPVGHRVVGQEHGPERGRGPHLRVALVLHET